MRFNFQSFRNVSLGLAFSLGIGYVITPYMGAHSKKRKDPEKEAKKKHIKDALLWRQEKQKALKK
jgi:hypothetical protein